MAKTLQATRAQVHAARLIVARADRGIGTASPAVRAIANAKPATRPSAATSPQQLPATGA